MAFPRLIAFAALLALAAAPARIHAATEGERESAAPTTRTVGRGDVVQTAAVTAVIPAEARALATPALVGGGGPPQPTKNGSSPLRAELGPLPPDSTFGGEPFPGGARAFTERRRLGIATSEALAIHFTMMGWNRYVGNAEWSHVSGDSLERNLRSRWVLDDDDFWVNQFGHPYQGTWSYAAARSAGLGFWTSTAFPIAASALWELGGETTLPSVNDQLTTPVAGVVLGEALWRVAEAIRAQGGTVNEVIAGMLSPMSALNGQILGRTAPRPIPSTRFALQLGGIAGDGARVGWPDASAPRPYLGVELTWGLPGDPNLELDEPFDHFVLQGGYGAVSDPLAVMRIRGLLVGAKVEPAETVAGLWGLFLSFDFDTTGPYRVSTSALGVGASGRAELGGGLALETSAVASAILMGAMGDRPRFGEGRDYRFGPGEQAVLDVRLRADPRVSGGVALRQYLVVGDGPGAGADVLVETSAGFQLQIVGPHAVGAEVAHHFRWLRDVSGGLVTGEGDVVRVYYALAGG